MKLISFIIILLFLGIPFLSHGQNWDKKKSKIESALHDGKYEKAVKKSKKLQKRTTKKLKDQNPYLPFIHKVNATYALQVGFWDDFEKEAQLILSVSQTLFDSASYDYAYQRFQLAKLWSEAGFFKKAFEELQLAKRIFKSKEASTQIRLEMIVLEADLLVRMGQYSDALHFLSSESAFTKANLHFPGKNKDESTRRLQHSASLANLTAQAYLGKGNLAQADSVLSASESLFENRFLKKDWNQIGRLTLKAEIYENLNNAKQAEDFYEKAYDLSKKVKRSEERLVMQRYEVLIDAYYRLGNSKKGGKTTEKYLETARKIYKMNSFHLLQATLMEAKMNFYEGNATSLEKNLQVIEAGESRLPTAHLIRLAASDLRFETEMKNKNFNKAYEILQAQCMSTELLYGANGFHFHRKEMLRAAHLFDYTDELFQVKEVIERSYIGFLKSEISHQHRDFIHIHDQLISFYRDNNDFPMALSSMKESMTAAQSKLNYNHKYGQKLVQYADLLYQTGELTESKKYLDAAEKILKPVQSEDENISAYASIMLQKARTMSLFGDFEQAEDELKAMGKFLTKNDTKNPLDDISSLELKAEMAQNAGNFFEAERILNAAIEEIEKAYGFKTRKTLESQLSLGRLKLMLGDFTSASAIADDITNKAALVYGVNNLKHLSGLFLQADISAAFGDYENAEREVQKVLEGYMNSLGDKHLDIAKIYSKLALVKINIKGREQESAALLYKAIDIVKSQIGTDNPLYADLLTYSAYIDISTKQFPKAFENLSLAEQIWASKSGKKNNAKAANINVLQGDVYYFLKNFKTARQHYRKSEKLYLKYFSDNHPDFVKLQAKISRLEYMEGNEKKAIQLIETVMGHYDQYIQEFFPILSEREKARFWNMIKEDYEFYNSLILKSAKNFEDKKIAKLYDNAINTKALLLNTSIRLRQNILESNDESTIQNFNKWLTGKELLSRVLTLNTEEMAEQNVNKDSLISEIESLEKFLSSQSDLFTGLAERKNLSWEDVKSVLKENEVAVEIIRFRHFDHIFTDSVIYAAIVLQNRKRSDKPEIVIFDDGKGLESKYFKAYKNNIIYQMHDELSYEKFWKPIADKVGKLATIYLSPEGIFNQINLESIPSPDGRYIVDNFNIMLTSNTKNIYLKNKRAATNNIPGNKSVMLYGNPQFYTDASANINRHILPLPGTHEEVETISTLFLNKGWETYSYLDIKAKEETIKEMDRPGVFHIATHGFYDSGKQNDTKIEIGENHAVDNPLMRSGLMLKGAGEIIAKTSYNFNIQNGILTAYEAMNLDLSQTELVVLSACETGAGDISIGEGVYGLQRAFLVAGAKVLIMSLFKVNDEITKTLMVNFYTRWLETGDIRNSFAEARNIVRSQHPDPKYWGAFIILM